MSGFTLSPKDNLQPATPGCAAINIELIKRQLICVERLSGLPFQTSAQRVMAAEASPSERISLNPICPDAISARTRAAVQCPTHQRSGYHHISFPPRKFLSLTRKSLYFLKVGHQVAGPLCLTKMQEGGKSAPLRLGNKAVHTR